jgi:acyl-CoA thioester hydrolase
VNPDPCLYYNAEGKLVSETRFHVRFFETDQMGVVHHAAYITWFEEGRSAFTRAIGYPYSRMEAEGLSLAVAEVQARYRRPARYDEEVIIACCLEQLLSRGINFSYEIRRAADRELLVTGYSKHVAVDRSGAVVRIAEHVREGMLKGAEQALRRPIEHKGS